MNRRDAMGVLAGMAVAATAQGASEHDGVIYREFGKTGEKVSAIGLGGYHIGVPKDPSEGVRIIHSAVDRGINFLDNCWDYHDGESERRMGIALQEGGYRQKVFLMTKFDGRTKAAAAQQIDESLSRLKTDHIDLMQFHENIRLEDPDRFFAEDGAVEAMIAAKKAGKIRYFGFTGHKDPYVHLRMLELAKARDFHFDSCQMPLNIMDAHFRSFAHQVVPHLVERGIAVLGMKPLGGGNVLKSGVVTPIECLHYALNLPTTVVINGCDSMERLDQALEALKTFKPLASHQLAELLAKTRQAGTTGKFEPFKNTSGFDSTARNPQWMG